MRAQVRLRWLLRRACTHGVLMSNQIGMAVHALHQLDLLDVNLTSSTLSMLPVVQQLCGGADARSQANVLHALAACVTTDCDRRVVVHAELYNTVRRVQQELVEVADTLTGQETVLVMEALQQLMPYVGGDEGESLVVSQLVEEVRERTMALASVVERPMDLLGVARVVVNAARPHCAAGDAAPSHAATATFTSSSLDRVLNVVHARLDTFNKQELISLIDVVTVPRSSVAAATADDRGSAAATVAAPKEAVTLLDAARPYMQDILSRALATVPTLSVSQLCAWLTRLSALQWAHHPLFASVVDRLSHTDTALYTVPQLASAAGALSDVLTRSSEYQDVAGTAAPYLDLYASLLLRLSSHLHDASRDDAVAKEDARVRLLPLLCSVPEAALANYIRAVVLGGVGNERVRWRRELLTAPVPISSPSPALMPLLSICSTLAMALERAAAVLLRHMATLPPREQVNVASSVFYWRVYMPRVYMPCIYNGGAQAEGHWMRSVTEEVWDADDDTVAPSAKAVLQRCSPLSLSDTSRKHRALCGLVMTCSAGFDTRECVSVLNALVLAHHSFQDEQSQHLTHSSTRTADGAESVGREEPSSSPTLHQSVVTRASGERVVLIQLLQDMLLGPLSSGLGSVPTGQLVRYLSTLSRMRVASKTQYVTVLNILKSRALSGAELIAALEVMARHHVKATHVVRRITRALGGLGPTLTLGKRVKVLKCLGQLNGQRFVRAPCEAALELGQFTPAAVELPRLTFLQLAFCFVGLVELRQYTNSAVQELLREMSWRATAPTTRSTSCLASIKSATALAELLASFCRLGGPEEGVTAPLLLTTMEALERRLSSSSSLFVDLSKLGWYWPCVVQYFGLTSELWCDGERCLDVVPRRALWGFAQEDWLRLVDAFTAVRARAGALVAARLRDIAALPTLRSNTFLWGQVMCGYRFGGMPQRGSMAEQRLLDNLETGTMTSLVSEPQRLLDVASLALRLATEGREGTATATLRFLDKNMVVMRTQDSLQVWWYAAQLMAAHGGPAATQPSGSANTADARDDGAATTPAAPTATLQSDAMLSLVSSVHDAAKKQTLHGETDVMQKLSRMERRILESLQ
ncbi:hypothetical protein NESM_000266000 [Novymonas esmeraldas]|uniref:Uncharacterized protein n=1 Tax=Novymonas esmeraldas TaxID=1808958 RepID=A0AAW0FB96_9TRYP